jgi:hypothetical protein
LFEAIDEPWKSNQNAQDPPWQGSNGAEGHYGFWYFDDHGQYMQKKDSIRINASAGAIIIYDADYIIPGNNSPQRITNAQFKGL